MNRFIVMLIALAMAFGSGWLFANEVRPPLLEDVGLAMWIAVGGVGFLSAIMASNGR
jgi:sorbitol-specific phosphotransferase system component IIBC